MTRQPAFRAGLLLALAVLTTLAADALTPRQHLADSRPPQGLAELVPARIGSWTWDPNHSVVQASPDVQATLKATYTDLLGRTYVNERGGRMMVSLAYVANAVRGTNVHRPEVCYPAQGFAVRALDYASVGLPGGRLPVVRAVMHRQTRHEPVTYWIVVGNTLVDSPWAARWAQLRYSLGGTQPDALLVRLSTLDKDPAQGFAAQEAFIRDLATTTDMPLRERLFGALAMDAQQAH